MSAQLPVSHVVVGTAQSDAPEIEGRLDAYRNLLSAEETTRVGRFVHQQDAARFVIGRALARTMLSRYANVAPRDWPFVIDEHGRPSLGVRPTGVPDLRFNLSHTPGLVACAVAIGREVGVDVEHVRRQVTHDIPERFFSAREVTDLRALPDAEQHAVFFDYWTLKEAYIKARGLGLALPLRHFTFLRTPGRTPSIAFAPELHDDATSWQFAQFWPTVHHRMSVAVRRTGQDLPIFVEPIIPEIQS